MFLRLLPAIVYTSCGIAFCADTEVFDGSGICSAGENTPCCQVISPKTGKRLFLAAPSRPPPASVEQGVFVQFTDQVPLQYQGSRRLQDPIETTPAKVLGICESLSLTFFESPKSAPVTAYKLDRTSELSPTGIMHLSRMASYTDLAMVQNPRPNHVVALPSRQIIVGSSSTRAGGPLRWHLPGSAGEGILFSRNGTVAGVVEQRIPGGQVELVIPSQIIAGCFNGIIDRASLHAVITPQGGELYGEALICDPEIQIDKITIRINGTDGSGESKSTSAQTLAEAVYSAPRIPGSPLLFHAAWKGTPERVAIKLVVLHVDGSSTTSKEISLSGIGRHSRQFPDYGSDDDPKVINPLLPSQSLFIGRADFVRSTREGLLWSKEISDGKDRKFDVSSLNAKTWSVLSRTLPTSALHICGNSVFYKEANGSGLTLKAFSAKTLQDFKVAKATIDACQKGALIPLGNDRVVGVQSRGPDTGSIVAMDAVSGQLMGSPLTSPYLLRDIKSPYSGEQFMGATRFLIGAATSEQWPIIDFDFDRKEWKLTVVTLPKRVRYQILGRNSVRLFGELDQICDIGSKPQFLEGVDLFSSPDGDVLALDPDRYLWLIDTATARPKGLPVAKIPDAYSLVHVDPRLGLAVVRISKRLGYYLLRLPSAINSGPVR